MPVSTFYTNAQVIGNNILHRGYENGVRVQNRIPFSPTFYVPTQRETQFKTIYGQPVEPIQPGSIKESREFVESYKGVSNFEIFGNTNYVAQYLNSLYPPHTDAEFDMSLIRILDIDIEVESEDGFSTVTDATERVNVVTLRHHDRKWVLAVNPFVLPQDPKVFQKVCDDETDLLRTMIDIWREIDPDVISGWNVRFFDLPYLVNRIQKILGENEHKKMSPWGIVKDDEVEYHGKNLTVYNFVGIDTLDYYELYRKYVLEPRENYKLDHIAEVELKKKKVDYSQYANIREFYTQDFQRFVEYNVMDVDLVRELDEKLGLLEMHLSMAYMAKVNYSDVYSQIKTWDSIIYNHLLDKNVAIPFTVKNEKDHKFEGAYVKEPIVGFHDWVVSFDVASMYPNIIRLLNISPETCIEGKIDCDIERFLSKSLDLSFTQTDNVSVGGNGSRFHRDTEGFMSELTTKFYNLRKTAKKGMISFKKQLETLQKSGVNDPIKEKEYNDQIKKLDIQQKTAKIGINSLYGVCGSPFFRFYRNDNAEAITKTGQLIIRWLQQECNRLINKLCQTKTVDYCIASDTDSIFLDFETIVNQNYSGKSVPETVDWVDKFCKTVMQPYIDIKIREISNYLNCYQHTIEMVRDAIADRAIWKAKKMYCMHVHDTEGVRHSEPKLKIMGIEVQRSSTPNICRKRLKECVRLLLTSDEKTLAEYIEAFRVEFKKCSIADVAFPRGVNDMAKWKGDTKLWAPSTPIAVRGAIVYNDLLKRKGVDKKYDKIGDGEKIKFVYLKEPNPARSNAISFPGKMPKEVDIDKYVDYDTQFEKAFLQPILGLLEAAKWKHEMSQDLGAFFE